ncbi:hypothetical protein [Streptomyces sp. NBC_00564]|uniref:hypothetical protein n=1 Tax=Streptomyces sp. NBC_00564 TaxID=2903663 RepID=UPI00352FAF8C|nr:hypothetical protein OG256_24885 [Streptomyces sp. NBC_00564]
MSTAPMELQSERVIVQAPLSFAGSTKRILRLTEPNRAFALKAVVGPWWKGALRVVLDCLLVLTVGVFMLLAWTFIAGWYLLWGIFLIPYRLIRRSDRNRKREALQHREMLDAAIAAQVLASNRVAEPESPRATDTAELPAAPKSPELGR